MVVFFVVLAIRYQIKLLTYAEWGDEYETIVTVKMLASGSRLYSEVFNHHGPLTFLTGYFLEKIGNFGVPVHRVPIAILQWIALAAIYFSPLVNDKDIRLTYTGMAASAMLLYLPGAFGHMYLYQAIAGLLLIIVLAQYSLTSISCPEKLNAGVVAFGNLLIGSLPFLAVSYVPISLLLFVISLRRAFFWRSVAWLMVGVGLNIFFLLLIGSIPGYLAYHLYMNSQVLALYDGGHNLSSFIEAAISNITQPYKRSLALIVIALSIGKLATREKGFPWRALLVGLGFASLLIRAGHFFQGLPYYYAVLACPLIFFTGPNRVKWRDQSFVMGGVFAILFFMTRLSLAIPADSQEIESRQIPKVTEFSQLAQIFTVKGDKIIAYAFQNFEYLAADRLPASGHFFFLPWQEKYNENPQYGIKIDACRDIDSYRPKIMLIDKQKVWGIFTWESYGGCIDNIINKDYIQILNRPYYVRKDIFPHDIGIATAQQSFRLQPSGQLGVGSPISVLMASSQQDERAKIKRIGVLFGTHTRKNLGEAELRLQGFDGIEFIQRFPLVNLADNKFHYFEVDSKRYVSGKILAVTGGGVSTWESHSPEGNVSTCISYEYTTGKRRFTPGCPLF
jgi:MFS family permease